MRRRAFLGFLGGAVGGGKSVVMKAATLANATVGIETLSLAGIGMTGSDSGSALSPSTPTDKKTRIVELVKLVSSFAKTKHQLMQDKKNEFGWSRPHYLDPNLHALRSVSLQHKVAAQTEANLWKAINEQKSWIQKELDQLRGLK